MKATEAKNIKLQPDWLLFDTDVKGDGDPKPVSTFIPEVIADVEVYTSAGLEHHIELRLYFNGNQSETFMVSQTEPEKINWFEKDKRCILNPSYPKAKEYIANTIRLGLITAPVKKLYRLDRLGIRDINDNIMFVAGDRVITQSPGNKFPPNVELAPSPFKLDIDPNLTPKETFEGMKELIGLSCELGRPLLAHSVSGITRSAFVAAGMPPSTVLEVIGDSGSFKTYYTPTVTQLYNRGEEVKITARLNSSDRFIEDMLYLYSECTVVIDDRCTAESSKIKRKNDDTAEEIIRRVGDNIGRGRVNGNSTVLIEPRGNVVFTGEYPAGIKSTVARGLVINVTIPIDGKKLDKYQRQQPLIISTFYYYFIIWYVNNYSRICNEISKGLSKFRETVSGIHPRLRQTQFCLQTAYMLIMEFCKDSGFITTEMAQRDYHSFGKQLVGLIQAQQARINPSNEKTEKIDYLKLIRRLYISGDFSLTGSREKFARKKDKYDGLIYYDCLCIRGESLEKQVQKIFHGAKLKDVINALLADDALKKVSEKHTLQISGLNGMRFYAIWLNKLR